MARPIPSLNSPAGLRQFPGSGDRCAADRTWDRVEAMPGSAARPDRAHPSRMSSGAFGERESRDRHLRTARSREPGSQGVWVHLPRLSRLGALSSRVPPGRARSLSHRGMHWSARDSQAGYTLRRALSGTVPVQDAPFANYPGRRRDRRRLPAPILTKIAARHWYNPKLDRA